MTASQQQPPNTTQQQQGQQARPKEPPTLTEAALYEAQHRYIQAQHDMRFYEWLLGVQPSTVALCPHCRKTYNKRGGGGRADNAAA